MQKFVPLLFVAAITITTAPGQTLMQPGEPFDGTVGPHPYFNPSADRLKTAVRKAMPSRRAAVAPVLNHVLAPLDEKERSRLKPARYEEGRPYLQTVGVHRKTGVDLSSAGQWQTTQSGQRLFRFSLRSTGASGVRFHFENFHVGAGRVWIHDGSGDESEIFGPWTGNGPWDNGEFWSDYVLSENITLEFEPGPDFREGDPLPFEVREISHLADVDSVLPRPMSDGPERFNAVACHLDASCYADWQQSARGIARMLFEVEGGAATCTGTLLNTRTPSNIPWFLTADHCISNEAQARTLQAFWFYQTQLCNGQAPDSRSVPRTLGASYIAGIPFERGDATLLRLREIPNGVMFLGWSSETVALAGTATGVHHPGGSHRRISFGSLTQPVPYRGIDTTAFIGINLDGGGLTQPGSSGSALFARPGVIIGQLSHGPKMELNEYCGRLPFPISYGRFSLFYPQIRQYLEGGDNSGGNNPPPDGGNNQGRALTSGVPVSLTMPAVEAATLFSDLFEIVVPQGATRLEVRLTAPAQAQVAVLARHGQPPVVENGQAVADSVQSGGGTQTIVLNPPRAGTYFIRAALLTLRTQVPVELMATVTAGTTGTTPPPAGGGSRQLTSGQAVQYQFAARPSSTLYTGENGFTIQVPSGAQRLEIQLRTDQPNVDVDLYARFGQDVTIESSRVVADHRSEGNDGNETITITPSSSPVLRAGTYYISLGVLSPNVAVSGSVRATVTTSGGGTTPGGTGSVLVSGQPRDISIPAVQNAVLLNGTDGYRIEVPSGATQLEVTLRSSAQADLDLFVRGGQDVGLEGNRVVADARSENNDSNERIVISGASLRPGTYYIALVQFTRNVAVQAVLTATVSGGTTPGGGTRPPGGPGSLTPGSPAPFRIGPVESPTLFNGEYGFILRVPEGATRVDLNLRTTTPNVDVDLYVRRGADVAVEDRRPAADHLSESETGQETIVIDANSRPALQPGEYYIAFGLFNPNVEAIGTITATIVTGGGSGSGIRPVQPTILSPGQPARFSLPSVDQPTLFNGNYSFAIDVPEGASRLQINLASEFPQVDTDLYVRYGDQPTLSDGDVIAEHVAGTDFANETLIINAQSSPALRPGRYWISIASFTVGAQTSGTITATVSRSIFAQTQSEQSKRLVDLQERSEKPEPGPFALKQQLEPEKFRIKQEVSQ
jgi:hypothetical protein